MCVNVKCLFADSLGASNAAWQRSREEPQCSPHMGAALIVCMVFMKEIYLYFYFLINWAPRKVKQKQIYQRQVHKILRKAEGSIFPPICSVAENIIFKARKVKTSLYRLCRNRL